MQTKQELKRNNFTPIGTHGFYLPTIKAWNMFAKAIREDMNKDFVFKGSIEDYIFDENNENCIYCGNEMKRTLLETNFVLNGASIFCPNSLKNEHPKEYWVEVWPNASNKILNNDKLLKLSPLEVIKNNFILSNKIIKSCWDGRLNSLLYYFKAMADEDFPDCDNSDILHKEEYKHS